MKKFLCFVGLHNYENIAIDANSYSRKLTLKCKNCGKITIRFKFRKL